MGGEASSAEGFGFGRQQRLLTAAHYAEVFAARRVLRGSHFALHYRQNGLHHARLGLVIPKKQARSAVLRNAIKRQVREIFRLRQADLTAVDVVLRLARPIEQRKGVALAVEDRTAWRTEITALFNQLACKVAP